MPESTRMPIAEARPGVLAAAGHVFVAFCGASDAFEAQLRHMFGAKNDIRGALFDFTRLVSSACFRCPPMRDGHVDLRPLGL